MSAATYRWIDGPFAKPEEWSQIDALIAERGWMAIDHNYSRVRVVEEHGRIVSFFVVQAIPHCGPMYVDREHRGTGIPDRLSDDVLEFLRESECRGVLIMPENAFSERLCIKYGLERYEGPVYIRNERVM